MKQENFLFLKDFNGIETDDMEETEKFLNIDEVFDIEF